MNILPKLLVASLVGSMWACSVPPSSAKETGKSAAAANVEEKRRFNLTLGQDDLDASDNLAELNPNAAASTDGAYTIDGEATVGRDGMMRFNVKMSKKSCEKAGRHEQGKKGRMLKTAFVNSTCQFEISAQNAESDHRLMAAHGKPVDPGFGQKASACQGDNDEEISECHHVEAMPAVEPPKFHENGVVGILPGEGSAEEAKRPDLGGLMPKLPEPPNNGEETPEAPAEGFSGYGINKTPVTCSASEAGQKKMCMAMVKAGEAELVSGCKGSIRLCGCTKVCVEDKK